MVFVFYTSSHGLGHASRDIEVARAIVRRMPRAHAIVRTTAPAWFFDVSTQTSIERQSFEADTGVVQIDSLALDEDETARRAARFYAAFDRRADEEAAVLRRLKASVVIGDIPPLAFAASDRAGMPSIALGNFTWDWIYGAYPQFERLAPGVIDVIRRAYARATLALRLPLHGGFDAMKPATRDIPLVARRSRLGRDDARRALELDDEGPVVLASFGGYGLRLPYADIARDGDFTLVVTDHETGDDGLDGGSRLRRFRSSELARRGVGYEDLVAASDVVVSKPGYGIVSECIANHAALLYTSRGRFVEYDVFVAGMPRVLRCRYISRDDLLAGRWTEAVFALLQQPAAPETLATDGAEAAANAILEIAASVDVRPT